MLSCGWLPPETPMRPDFMATTLPSFGPYTPTTSSPVPLATAGKPLLGEICWPPLVPSGGWVWFGIWLLVRVTLSAPPVSPIWWVPLPLLP